MEFVRHVDFAAIDKSGADERLTQALLDHASGATTCTSLLHQDAGRWRVPRGPACARRRPDLLHLAGHDEYRDRGKAIRLRPGSLIVFPAGVPHRNWNGGSEPTVHLAL